ncbi:FAD/NAD(P)-binding protein [Streptomyces antimicrobicus]|uniref:FAD/NAD(P)-binding protein n=1 Tax=Streptomyces antimicrobicus TaxID=2883108 RepID=A0ABS8B4J6_9ACTN|nr:FAD/NAD(P)-binding protein [Streptomyces antimicrobicus]MCB5179548.1 FAD/NAD(P)-binding protein [Streptomyces antimicrobicus]
MHTPDRPPTRIGLVGGGAAAVCLLDRLSRTPGRGRGSVTVFEPSPNLWRGRAYQDDADSVLANIIPPEMGARSGEPDDFLRWLKDSGLSYGTGDYAADGYFPPRRVFGSYLEHTAENAVGELSLTGWPVTVLRTAVLGARRDGEEIELTDATGATHTFDYVVCAVGAGRPADHYGLDGAPGYVGDPYPLATTVTGIPATADVTVLGTGLAAVDAVVTLAARGHEGRITMASRGGTLPAVRQRPAFPEIHHFTPAALHATAAGTVDGRIGLTDVLDLLGRELAAHGADPATVLAELSGVDGEDPMERLRRQYAGIDTDDIGLRVMQHVVPESGPDAWTLLRPEDQDHIRSTHYRAVMSLCCPMPPANARTLLRLHDAGRLRVTGGLWNVKPLAAGGFHVAVDGDDYESDVVVNAVSAPSHRVPGPARPFVDALVEDGMGEYHPHGGLHIEPSTSRTIGAGRTHRRMHVIGDMGAGTLFFTSGMPSVLERADDIVRAVVEDLTSAPAASALAARESHV